MEKVALNHVFNPSVFRLFEPSLSNPKRPDYVNFSRSHKKKFLVLASKGEPPSLNKWELMELKFGRMIEEDPKLTMAKIMGKRMNPHMTDLEIEKMFYNKKKGKIIEIKEMPFDAYDNRRPSKASDGLNLVRPVLKKGQKFEVEDKPKEVKLKKPGQPVINAPEVIRSKVPNVILHKKPSIYSEEGGGDEELERLRIKPNFSLQMSREQTKDRFTDLTLIRKPKPVNLNLENEEENQETTTSKQEFTSDSKEYDLASLLEKPKMNNEEENQEATISKQEFTSNVKASLLEKPKMNDEEENQEATISKQEFTSNIKASLLEKPKMSLENVKENQEATISKQEFTSNVKASLLEKPKMNDEEENQEATVSKQEFTSNIKASLLEKPKMSLENVEENQEATPSKQEFISNVKDNNVASLLEKLIKSLENKEENQETTLSKQDLIGIVEERDASSLLEKPKMKVKNDEENQEATLSKKELTRNIEKYDISSVLEKPKINLRKDEEHQEASPSIKEVTSNIPEYDLSSLLKKPKMNLENEKENQEATPSKRDFFTSSIEDYNVSLLLEKPKMNFDSVDNRQVEGSRDYSDNMAEKDLTEFLEDQGQEMNLVSDFDTQVTVDAALQGKPERLDQYSKERQKTYFDGETVAENDGSDDIPFELESFAGTYDIKESEDADWERADDLVRTGKRIGGEIISSSTRGYVVSFGSLVGFIPYRYLSPRWKYYAFETWLRRNDIDPASYKENLGVIEPTFDPRALDQQLLDSKSLNSDIKPGMKIEDLTKIYELEKRKFMNSFVGQKISANVISVDRASRRLIFSSKPREMDETIARKRKLMAKLKVGDIVECCIIKITFFGVFVKVEGVDALIHQTEVSWDSTLDPSSYFKIGQIVKAKVHQLDFSLERICLSLKELTPDPLIESFESVLSNNGSLLEGAEPETEWADVETLIKELDQVEGIESVSKGRYCLSPSSAPTFQVYMASMFDNQYKLLARSENRVQEVIVETSLSKDEMKSVIQTCTNRVA